MFFPILGLMQSSKATNNRPSVSDEGINPQTVCQSFYQGNVEDAINVEKRFFLISILNKVTRERSKLDVIDDVNGTITASSV